MAGLVLTASLIYPPTRGASPPAREAIAMERRRGAKEVRDVLNAARRTARANGPRNTGAMLRSARVRRLRAQYPGAVSFELRISKFYASFTNSKGRHRGWFDNLEKEVERLVYGVGVRSAQRLLKAYPNVIFHYLTRVAARSAGVTVRR